MEIANYGRSPKTVVTENKTTSNVEFIKESTNGTYGIVREKDGYYVKKGLTESSLDYIGGIFMKNKNKFSSYSESLKRLELISGQETLSEAKKYVLKSKTSVPASPVEDIPSDPVASEPTPSPVVDDVPMDNVPMDDAPMDEPSSEPEIGDTSDENDSKRSDYMAEVQKFSGKLGQSLRDVKERMESDDIKYVINMILSAVDLDSLDEEDKEEIAERFEPKEEEGFQPSDDMGGDIEDVPSEEPDFTSDEEDIDEIMSKLESFIDTPVAEEEVEEKVDLNQFNDLGIGEEEVYEEDEDVEFDLNELKNEINKHVDDTLSKYFN